MPSSMLGITDAKMSDWVQKRLTPHPYSTYEGVPIASGDATTESNTIPRIFIHCTNGPLSSWMEPFVIRARKLEWNIHTISAGHDVMITNPEDLAKILLQIVSQ